MTRIDPCAHFSRTAGRSRRKGATSLPRRSTSVRLSRVAVRRKARYLDSHIKSAEDLTGLSRELNIRRTEIRRLLGFLPTSQAGKRFVGTLPRSGFLVTRRGTEPQRD